MTTYTTQQKYDSLCAQLLVQHLDYCENDGLIVLKPSIYFQFPAGIPPCPVDGAIIEAMRLDSAVASKMVKARSIVNSKAKEIKKGAKQQ